MPALRQAIPPQQLQQLGELLAQLDQDAPIESAPEELPGSWLKGSQARSINRLRSDIAESVGIQDI